MNAITPTIITQESCHRHLVDTMQACLRHHGGDLEAQVASLQTSYHGHLYIKGEFGTETTCLGSQRLVFVGTVLDVEQRVTVGW